MNLADLNRWIAPLKLRVAGLVSRGVVKTVDDSTKAQTLQLTLLAEEVRSGLERLQSYGFTAHPHPGAEAVTVSVGGARDHLVVIAVEDRRYRVTGLERGEVAVYDDLGTSIVLKRGQKVEVTAGAKVTVTAPEVEIVASTKATLTSPLVECSGDLTVTGTVTGAEVKAGSVSLGSHVHASGALVAPSGGGPVTGATGGPS